MTVDSGAISTTFQELGELSDGNLCLVLEERIPADRDTARVPAYRFVIQVAGEPVGSIELRLGTSDFMIQYAGQIGYGVRPPFRGRRYAARALKLVLPLARRHGFAQLWITCNPDNGASRRTCELVGAALVEIVDIPEGCDMYIAGERRKCRYLLAL
jgi:predicted acetyltransferase